MEVNAKDTRVIFSELDPGDVFEVQENTLHYLKTSEPGVAVVLENGGMSTFDELEMVVPRLDARVVFGESDE